MFLTDSQHYSFKITLDKEFLIWVHSHKAVDGELGHQPEFWKSTQDKDESTFGGKHGIQFSTLDEIQLFNTEFDAILKDHKIDAQHKHPLFYMMSFLNEDYEQQSIKKNLHNELLNYSRFLLNLIADSLSHISSMRKNALYEEVFDEYTQEFFFAKKELVASMSHEDLLIHVPDAKNADDVVKYLRITIYEDAQLYVPEDLIIAIQSKKGRKLKILSGAQANLFEIPSTMKYEVFTFIVKHMVALHKRHNTQFYQDLISDNIILDDFKGIEQKFKKHNISYTSSLARVGILVTDYLLKHKLFTSKRSIAQFLFEYFALFKAIRLKNPVVFPDKYEDLIAFYIQNGANGETIRNMMKDAGEI
ncbi:MAG TPA: hypothetical protein VNW51_03855 [Mucilaginibacter sp.]|jgi:hypothetical protein|nr:hypothetical protein [Mucilaginibacter sp.]